MKKILSVLLVLMVGALGYFAYQNFMHPVLGTGEKGIEIVIVNPVETKTLEIETDADYLMDVLLEVEDEVGLGYLNTDFGNMITELNGYIADAANQEFYAFYVNEEMAMTGVDDTPVVDGDVFKFNLETWE